MSTWRFIDTGTSTASCNMAIDQAILFTHASGKCPPTLRIYQWDPPAISLGYFQRRHGIDRAACQNLGIDVIRRHTGGRAVLHFGDLTYSVVAGIADGMPSSVTAAYQLICKGLLTAFQVLGFNAEMRNSSGKSPRSDNCFLTSTAGDILYEGKKFVGSAQTWYQSSMLQHGSIVLESHHEVWIGLQGDRQVLSRECKADLENEMTSIGGILGYVPEKDEISNAILDGMTKALGIQLEKGDLNIDELTLANKIASQYVEKDLVHVCRPAS